MQAKVLPESNSFNEISVKYAYRSQYLGECECEPNAINTENVRYYKKTWNKKYEPTHKSKGNGTTNIFYAIIISDESDIDQEADKSHGEQRKTMYGDF